MTILLDLVLLLVIAKEAVQLGSVLPLPLWGMYIIALPYFLGMATSLREGPRFLRNPIRALIAQGVTLTSAILFVNLLAYRGLAAAFWAIFLVTVLSYGMGQLFGLTLKALLGLAVVGATALLVLQH